MEQHQKIYHSSEEIPIEAEHQMEEQMAKHDSIMSPRTDAEKYYQEQYD